MSEKKLINEIQLKYTENGDRLFRQNTGQGWVGTQVSYRNNILTLINPRPLIAGLCEGSSDLIGWRSREITIDMIGKRIAQFAAIEVKYGKTATTQSQKNFIEAVNAAGGFAKIVRSMDDL